MFLNPQFSHVFLWLSDFTFRHPTELKNATASGALWLFTKTSPSHTPDSVEKSTKQEPFQRIVARQSEGTILMQVP